MRIESSDGVKTGDGSIRNVAIKAIWKITAIVAATNSVFCSDLNNEIFAKLSITEV